MPEANLTEVMDRLEGLASRLEGMTGSDITRAREAMYRETLFEAVVVLEETKHAFRSRRLKDLRERIESVLRQA
jgi:hypothetical protein